MGPLPGGPQRAVDALRLWQLGVLHVHRHQSRLCALQAAIQQGSNTTSSGRGKEAVSHRLRG